MGTPTPLESRVHAVPRQHAFDVVDHAVRTRECAELCAALNDVAVCDGQHHRIVVALVWKLRQNLETVLAPGLLRVGP